MKTISKGLGLGLLLLGSLIGCDGYWFISFVTIVYLKFLSIFMAVS